MVCTELGYLGVVSLPSRALIAPPPPSLAYLGPSVPGVLEPVLGAAVGPTLGPFPSLPSWGGAVFHIPHPCGTVFAHATTCSPLELEPARRATFLQLLLPGRARLRPTAHSLGPP